MKIAIVGGGVIGCAIACAAQRKGFDCVVLEKLGAVGHGSTSASCAIIRRFYTQPGMVALAQEGSHIYADWRGYVGAIDDDLIRFPRPGMLFIPPTLDAETQRIVADMRAVGVPCEILTKAELRQRFPFLDTGSHPPLAMSDPAVFENAREDIAGAVYEADAGYVVSSALATQNLRLAAEREGARFELNCEVVAIESTGSRFEVRTAAAATVEADAVVNAGGPYSSHINRLAGVALPLETRPLRQEVHAVANPLAGQRDDVPVVGDTDAGVYWRPDRDRADIIVGSTEPDCDPLDWVDDPDDYPDQLTNESWERQTFRLMRRFPAVGRGSARGVVALYDVTPADWYPIVDKTQLPGYYVCIGTSGSSFKTSPVLGQLVAALIEADVEGRDPDEVPLQLTLPRTGVSVDCSFLSRNRAANASSGTVLG